MAASPGPLLCRHDRPWPAMITLSESIRIEVVPPVAPELAVADGALSFWKALGELWPTTRE
jgi:hypothetical protein